MSAHTQRYEIYCFFIVQERLTKLSADRKSKVCVYKSIEQKIQTPNYNTGIKRSGHLFISFKINRNVMRAL